MMLFWPLLQANQHLLCCQDLVDTPILSINLDYGPERLQNKKAKRKKTTRLSDKEKKNAIPSWASKDEKLLEGERDGEDIARRLCNKQYGKGNYPDGTNTEFSKIQKYYDVKLKPVKENF
jgi:hypothetical protein